MQAGVFVYLLDFQRVVVITCAETMSVTSSDSNHDNSLHEDGEENEMEEEESEVEEEEKLEEDNITETGTEELEETAAEEETLEEDSMVEPGIEELQQASDMNMERELSIVAMPPKIVSSEENRVEVSSSPAFQILDTVSILCALVQQ